MSISEVMVAINIVAIMDNMQIIEKVFMNLYEHSIHKLYQALFVSCQNLEVQFQENDS